MAEDRERLESIEEASKRLSVSTFTTRRLIKAKHIRAVRVGRRILVPESEITRVIAEGCGKHAVVAHEHENGPVGVTETVPTGAQKLE